MSANQGPGVPAELLRNQLKLRLMDQLLVRPVPDLTPVHADWMDETVAAIIDAVAASGHVIAARDRLERLNDVGTHALAYWEYQFAHVVATDGVSDLPDKARLLGLACMLLEDGDLDPVEPGVGR